MELSHMDKGVLAALVTWIAKTDKSISWKVIIPGLERKIITGQGG